MKLHELQVQYGLAEQIWEEHKSDRSALENLWEDCSSLTLPYVFPYEYNSESTEFVVPYNSVGPSAVNNLSSKLLLSLFPPSSGSFRLLPDTKASEGLNVEELKSLDRELSKIETEVEELISMQNLRSPLNDAMKYLVTVGNVSLYKVPNGSFKVFNPREYVIKRDYSGNLLEYVIKETISLKSLPINIINEVEGKIKQKKDEEKKDINIYTVVMKMPKGKYKVYQEVEEIVIESTIKTYNQDNFPYMVLRWTQVNGENYGRGLVEQYLGDFRSLEGLSQTLLETTGISAKTVFGMRPASTTNAEDFKKAQNGELIYGDLERDLSVFRVEKGADLNLALQMQDKLENRLQRAFLMASSSIRDSERTTAAEVRMTANELEATLGGTYSVLAHELQLPLIKILLNELEPKALKIATPSIVTGLSGISREKDFENLNIMSSIMKQFGQENLEKFLDIGNYFRLSATSLGINPDEIVKSKERIQKEQEQVQQQQMQLEQAKRAQQGQPQEGGQPQQVEQ